MQKRLSILLYMLILSTLVVALTGTYLKFEVLEPVRLHTDKSVIEVPFVVIKDPAARFALQLKRGEVLSTEASTLQNVPTQTEPDIQETMPTETQVPIDPLYFEITENWFDDVLFIGDSRTVGLRDYARLGKADYFCSVGMSVFKVLETAESDDNFPKMKLEQLLREKKYNKIYISLGLNDCQAPYELVMSGYELLVNTVRQLQPNAVIILQSMITLSREKAASETYFSLENIQKMNTGFREFADDDTILYIDANEYYADEEGYLPDGRAWDGCHFDVSGYEEWAQWILNNAKSLNISFG